jgi:hypothetical protein
MGSFALDRLVDVPCYLVIVGFLEALVLCGAAALALAWIPAWGWRWYVRRVLRWSLFAFILLVFGCVGNSAFMLIAYERLYISADTVVDFLPFIPFGQWVLDTEFGHVRGRLLGGAALWHVQLAWACVAAGVWCATLWAYRGLVHTLLDIKQMRGAAQQRAEPGDRRMAR